VYRAILLGILLLLSSNPALLADCPTSSLTLTTQAEVDAFKLTYPNCTLLNKGLFLDGEDITHLDSLHLLERIDAPFGVITTSVASLDGLSGITFIDEAYIMNNDLLSSLSGLDQLSELDLLWISNNGALSSLLHLEGLTTINHRLIIASNPGLTDLTGLTNLQSVGLGAPSDRIELTSLPNLTSLTGLDNLSTINGELRITSCGLQDLSGLEIITEIDRLQIKSNPNILSLEGLDSLQAISDELIITDNQILSAWTWMHVLSRSKSGMCL